MTRRRGDIHEWEAPLQSANLRAPGPRLKPAFLAPIARLSGRRRRRFQGAKGMTWGLMVVMPKGCRLQPALTNPASASVLAIATRVAGGCTSTCSDRTGWSQGSATRSANKPVHVRATRVMTPKPEGPPSGDVVRHRTQGDACVAVTGCLRWRHARRRWCVSICIRATYPTVWRDSR